MFRTRKFWFILTVLIVASGSYYYYNNVYAQPEEVIEETVQTTRVRQGSLVIAASGSGTLIPAEDVSLGFTSSGILEQPLQFGGERP